MTAFFSHFFNLYPMMAFIFLGVFSLLVGSFLNVVIYRLPLMINESFTAEALEFLKIVPEVLEREVNLCYPRSFCISCKKQISAWHNIPLFSFIILRGKCEHCPHKISWIYPVVEFLCLTLSLLVALYFGFSLTLFFVLPFVWILICLSFIDLKHQLLPDSLTTSLLWLGLLANTHAIFTTLPNAIYGAIGAYLGLWLFIKLFYLLTGKIGMGNGDFKLLAALGAWFGWNSLVFILLISSVLGASIGIIYLSASGKSRDTLIPFGPFLCIAGFCYLFLSGFIIWP